MSQFDSEMGSKALCFDKSYCEEPESLKYRNDKRYNDIIMCKHTNSFSYVC